jgi:hypothetical protein
VTRALSSSIASLCRALAAFSSFLIQYTVSRTPWTGDQSVARPLPKHGINAHNTDIDALIGIRTHDPSVLASEDGSCLRPRGHCDRPLAYIRSIKAVNTAHAPVDASRCNFNYCTLINIIYIRAFVPYYWYAHLLGFPERVGTLKTPIYARKKYGDIYLKNISLLLEKYSVTFFICDTP